MDYNFAPAIDDFVDHGDAAQLDKLSVKCFVTRIASHPCVTLACDTVWFKFATYYFLQGGLTSNQQGSSKAACVSNSCPCAEVELTSSSICYSLQPAKPCSSGTTPRVPWRSAA